MTSSTDHAVEFKNVDIIFGDEQARAIELLDQGQDREAILKDTGAVLGVAGATLSVGAGEICVLMGLSGSGKSTLLRAVNGLNKVTRGEILVQDGDRKVDVASCDASTLRHMRMSRIAMVFQQFALLPWRTVSENVGLGLELRGMPEDELNQIVQEKLKLVDLESWGDKYAHELSGGMQQRVGLARAFATDAEILLMDEPFSALDPLIRTHLQDELLDLQRKLKKTIVFVSHDLDEALKIGNHIAIMEGGRIVQYGEPEEIILNPANDYVRDFVGHVNPLNVLTGSAIMTAFEGRSGEINLDKTGHVRLHLATDGAPQSVDIGGKDGKLADGSSDPSTVCTAPTNISFREAIEWRQMTGNPVVLIEDGKAVGYIGDEEILNALSGPAIET
jgi:glycine betaine/proline transport system ATP-binding protein